MKLSFRGPRQPRTMFSVVLAITGIVALSVLVAPRIAVPLAVAEFISFVCGAGLGILGAASATATARTWRDTGAIVLVAVSVVVLVAVTRLESRWTAVAIDGALVAIGGATGGILGRKIEDPGHLLSACVVAACADITSVFSAYGPTHAIAESTRALDLLTVSFPLPGTRVVLPALGVGDLVFCALLVGATRSFALSSARATIACGVGVVLSGVAAALTRVPIPAIPAMAAVFLLMIPEARKVRRKDRAVTQVAIAVGATLAVSTVLSKLVAHGGAP